MWLQCGEKHCYSAATHSPTDQRWPVVVGAGPAWTLSPWFHWWWPSPPEELLLPRCCPPVHIFCLNMKFYFILDTIITSLLPFPFLFKTLLMWPLLLMSFKLMTPFPLIISYIYNI